MLNENIKINEDIIVQKDPISLILNPSFFETKNLQLTKFNLFVGKNGSGKSIALQTSTLDPNRPSFYIDENRFLPDKNRIVAANPGNPSLSHVRNSVNLTEKSDELDLLNQDLDFLFNRKIGEFLDDNGAKVIGYKKKNHWIRVTSDGRGIWNTVKVLESLYYSEIGSVLKVEELSLGIYPSIFQKFLIRLLDRISEKNMTLIATSQDPFLIYEFFKDKITFEPFEWNDKNPEFSIFKFTDNDGSLTIEKINETNFNYVLSGLIGDSFTNIEDRVKFDTLFNRES